MFTHATAADRTWHNNCWRRARSIIVGEGVVDNWWIYITFLSLKVTNCRQSGISLTTYLQTKLATYAVYIHSSLFPRPSHCPVFDRLQYANCKWSKTGQWEGLGMSYIICRVISWTISKKLPIIVPRSFIKLTKGNITSAFAAISFHFFTVAKPMTWHVTYSWPTCLSFSYGIYKQLHVHAAKSWCEICIHVVI